MNLQQLKYFAAIARNRSFSRASAELRVAQPALSRQVQLLEEEFDATFFLRSKKGVELTEMGRVFLESAEYQIRSFEQMREDMLSRSVVPSGKLRIGCPPALIRRLFSNPVKSIMKQYPHIKIEVRESISDQLAKDVFNNTLDIALASLTNNPAHLLVEKLFSEEIWLFANKDAYMPKQIGLDFLASVPLILPRHNNAIRELLETHTSREGLILAPAVETDSWQLSEALITAGLGYAIAPKFSLPGARSHSSVKGKAIPGFSVNRCLIRRKDRPESRAEKEFIRILRASIRSKH